MASIKENEIIEWSGYEWITKRRWGRVHPDKPYWWYDPYCVRADDDGVMHLITRVSAKYWPDLNKTSMMGAGMISCQQNMSHGIYEIEAKLPKGDHLWPAFWISHTEKWPPEIDILEAYSNSGGSYWNLSWPFFWHVETNLWYRTAGGKAVDLGAERGKISLWKSPHKNFIKYRLEWEPNVVRIFYDGKLVREVKEYLMLDKLNDNPSMYVTINNGIRTGFTPIDYSDFQIKYFTYKPY